MRRNRSRIPCAALGFAVVVGLATAGLASAGSTEDSTFMLRNTATFAAPSLDMVQGYAPSGAAVSCPPAPGDDWTCTWSSDTFIAGQSMAAGTAAVHLYPENAGGPIAFREAATTYSRGIDFVGAGPQVVGNGSGNTVTPALPSGWQPDDIAILIVSGRPTNTTEPGTPAGWTKRSTRLRGVGTNDLRITTYYRVLQSGDGNPGVTIPSSWSGNGGGLGAQVAVWRHVDVSNPFDAADVVGDSGAVDQWNAPTISTVTYSTRVVSAVATADDNALTMTTTNGFTSVMSGTAYDTTTGGDMAVGVAELHAWIGAQTMPRWDQTTNGSDAWAGITFALRLDPDVTIARPAGTAPGDVMLASIAVRPVEADITPPPGWTLIRRTDQTSSGTAQSLATYYKVAGASELASYTWTLSLGYHSVAGGIAAFSGVSTASPIDAEDGQPTPSALTHATPSVTTSVGGTMLVAAHASSTQGATWTPDPSMTEAFDAPGGWGNAPDAGHMFVSASWATQAAAGPTGAKTATASAAQSGNSHIVALRPATRTATLTVELLHNAAVIGSTTVDVSGPAAVALATATFPTSPVTFADGDRLHVRIVAPADPTNVSARVWFDAATRQARLVTSPLSCTVPDAAYAAATVAGTAATVYWSSSNAVMVLEREGAPVTDAPTNHTTYAVGSTIGATTVRYNGATPETSFTRTGLAPGSSYYYKVVPKNGGACYAAGLEVDGTASPGGAAPAWSYMMAGGSMLKPGIAGMGAIYTASNANRIISLDTATGLHTWSPVATNQPVQGWLSWVEGGPAGAVIGGDQSARVYSLDAASGAANWTADLSAKADGIQAGVAAQMRAYSDAAFQATYSSDVLFVASRNTGPTNCGAAATNNKLFALRADTGATLWAFNDACTDSVDYIVGMPYVDYTRNRIYLSSRGTGSTFWILDSLSGAVVNQLSLGHVDVSPALSYDGTTIYVANAAGTLYAIDATTFATRSFTLGSAVKSILWEDWAAAGRLYFTTADGNLWCVEDNGASFSQVWKVPVAGAGVPLLLDRLYVGSSDGRLHEFDLDGGNEKIFPAAGMLDGTALGDVSTEDGGQAFVGTAGGKLFKIQVPLP